MLVIINKNKEQQTTNNKKQNYEYVGGCQMFNEYEVRKQMCEIGQRIYNRGMVAANDGNFSVKISDNEFIATPTGVSKGFMNPSMLVKIDGDGKILASDGVHKPSSEIKMHLRVYKERPDINAVVHAHPMYATAFAIAGIPLTKPIMPEAIISLGCVPIAKYGMPSTTEIPDAVAEFLQNYDAVLLENHGALSYGTDLMNAYFKMESLEFYAQLLYLSTMLGGPKELPANEVERLYDLRKAFNLPGRHPGNLCSSQDSICSTNTCDSSSSNEEKQLEEVIREVTKRVLSKLG
ncbi:MAG: L-fuculose-phosphate aldolase [Clostridiales bacterium]|nr:L-fuculose-phosphate aldolase [Clostridiales bacterium]MDK2933694.1 L-fuculose-phosphate aldolase [Clostridiales bacterium]